MPTVPTLLTDGFDAPIGTPEERALAKLWPGNWYDSNPFLTRYELSAGNLAYHTGADLNLPLDGDAHTNVAAIANGVVVFADAVPAPSSWGNLVVIRHTMPGGNVVHSRYAHVETITVKKGDEVLRGQTIAHVGNANGRWAYHHHFDISQSGVLETHPADWPGLNLARAKADYTNPKLFIAANRSVSPATPIPTLPPAPEELLVVTADLGLKLHADHSTRSTTLEVMPQGQVVQASEIYDSGTYVWRLVKVRELTGWAAQKHNTSGEVYLSPAVTPPPPPTPNPDGPLVNEDWYTLQAMNFRRSASLSGTLISGGIPKDSKVRIASMTPVEVDKYLWVQVVCNGITGYTAWRNVAGDEVFLTKTAPTAPPPSASRKPVWGINIDPRNPAGNPTPATLKGVSFVRFVLKAASVLESLDQALNFYDPIISAYSAQGSRVLLIVSQETFTEKIPWQNNGQTWAGYTPGFAAMLKKVVARFGSRVYAYEIWNEQDISADTSMYIPPVDFGNLVRASVAAVNKVSKVVTGGLAGGDPVAYLKSCGDLSSVDGIGVHPYGKVASAISGLPNTGSLTTYLNTVRAAFPKLPMWITEYGVARVNVTDKTLWPKIAQYMKDTFAIIKARSDVDAAIWFAWSDPMDNAGIVAANQTPKGAIYDQFAVNVAFDRSGTYPNVDPTPAPTLPPPVPLPPGPVSKPNIPTTKNRVGLHIGSDAPGAALVGMASRLKAAGKPLGCVTVIVNTELANQMVEYTTVMYRMVVGRGAPDEPYGKLSYEGLDAAGAEKMGWDFYFGAHHETTQQLDKRVYIKLRNETYFHPLDCYFEIGAMKAAESEGRKLAIFGDSMSLITIEQWQQRVPALRYAMAHGHAVTLNQYGPYKIVNGERVPGDLPVSDDDGYHWYGEWPFVLYDSAPKDCRPYLIIGETGPSDSSFTRSTEFYIADMTKYDQLTRQYPYLIGWCYYTAGRWIGSTISLDGALPDIERMVLTL